jgi:hypothetical protein
LIVQQSKFPSPAPASWRMASSTIDSSTPVRWARSTPGQGLGYPGRARRVRQAPARPPPRGGMPGISNRCWTRATSDNPQPGGSRSSPSTPHGERTPTPHPWAHILQIVML